MPENTLSGSETRIGGELLAAMLAAEGVTDVFGIVDGTYLGLYTAFEKFGIRLISPRHETSAAHMAGAYARSTGRLGVCMASNGPGAANILPGVAVESGEGNRVLLITSCRRTGIAYPERGGTFQYFDQVGVTAPMTRWSGEHHERPLRVSHGCSSRAHQLPAGGTAGSRPAAGKGGRSDAARGGFPGDPCRQRHRPCGRRVGAGRAGAGPVGSGDR